ncbi:MAG: hypothetical protein ACLTS6_07710 [Anaerobutyricum sp.]
MYKIVVKIYVFADWSNNNCLFLFSVGSFGCGFMPSTSALHFSQIRHIFTDTIGTEADKEKDRRRKISIYINHEDDTPDRPV